MNLPSRAVGLLLATGLASLAASQLRPPPAAAEAPTVAATSYAALVVDTGTEVRTACVQFGEATITGRQLLERAAGIDPVFASIGGQGTAVCALCGVGCAAADCLTCAAPNYWAYHRAPTGSSSFTYSNAGAGATTVRHGDVEGWRWGTGAKPPFQSFASICPVAAPSTTQPTTTQPPTTASPPPSTSAPLSGAATTGPAGGPSTTSTAADTTVPSTPASTAGDVTSTSTTSRPADDDDQGGREGDDVAGAPVSHRGREGGDGWLGSALGFAVALAVVLGVALRLRRRRRLT